MAISLDSIRPSKLWKTLSDERREAAATAFWTDEQAGAEQAEVLGIIARQIHFRPKSVLGLPLERKIRLLVRMPQVSDTVGARLLVAYHLAHQRPMMMAFLDALGLPHEEGLLGEDIKKPERDELLKAGDHLVGTFSPDDVRLYFITLVLQDPETWGPLQEWLEKSSMNDEC